MIEQYDSAVRVGKIYPKWRLGKASGRDDSTLPGLSDYHGLNVCVPQFDDIGRWGLCLSFLICKMEIMLFLSES